MKKRTIVGMTVAAAAGTVGWCVTARRRKSQVDEIRCQVRRLLAVRRDALEALRKAAGAGELKPELLGPTPMAGISVESVRLENGLLTLSIGNEGAHAWLSDRPLDDLPVHTQPWQGSARPGVLYTESLGDGWYAGYICLRWK